MKIPTFDIYVNNTRNVTVSFSAAATRLGTTVSSVAWSVDDGNSVSLGTPTLSSNVATVPVVSTTRDGCSTILCLATMADSQIVSEYVKIRVVDPEC